MNNPTRNLACILLLLILTISGFAQRIEVTIGPTVDPRELRKEAGIPKVKFVSPFKSFSYSSTLFFHPAKKRTYSGFGWDNKAFQFAVLENYLTYNGIKKLTSETINEKVSLDAFIFLKDKLYVIFSQKFSDRDEFSVYVNEVSEDMVVLGTPVRLHTFKDLKKYGMGISVSSSENKDYVMITRLHETRPKEKQKIECKVMDASFSEVWYKMIETENMDKELELQSIAIDKTGNMHLLAILDIGKVKKPVVYSYFWNTKALKTFNLGLPTGENFGTRLKLLNNEKPYAVGLNKNGKSVSYFVDRINVGSQTLENLSSTPMPEDFYGASNKAAFETSDWGVSDIITLDDNSVVASIEAELLDPKYSVYHTYNTYVISFSETGTKKWSRVIQKKQVAMAGMQGHALLPAGNNVLVVYNDHQDNISKKPEDTKVEVFKSRDAMMVVQEIDPTGKVQKYPFSKDKQLDGYALHFFGTHKIEKGLYFAMCINIKGMMSVESKHMTFRIK